MFRTGRGRTSLTTTAAACCVLLAAATPTFAAEAVNWGKESYRAYAISLGGLQVGGTSAPSGATSVDFVVDRLSSDSERSELLAALRSGGRDKLYWTLDKMEPVGRIQIPGRLGYDLHYAREVTTEDGQRVLILATNRPLSIVETARQTRSREYDISVIELVLDERGNGSGTALPAVRVDFDPESGDITLADLNTLPIQLSQVRKIG